MKPVLLVGSPYYTSIHEMLVNGANAAIAAAGQRVELITVPGALEIPPAISMAARSGRYAAFVALGCVIRGETTHYETVANESARGLMELAIGHHHLALGNGILTVETMEQAIVRADPKHGNKGGDAAIAALRLLQLRTHFGLENA